MFADSMGAKCFCFRVDTDEVSLLIDPGAALFPKDHPTMTDQDKQEHLFEAWEAIQDAADGVQHVAISHWHGDHYSTPEDGVDFGDLYGGRTLWVKDPRQMINPGQDKKAHRFFEQLQDAFGGGYTQGEIPTPTGVTVRGADDAQIIYDETVVTFSRPLPHGDGTSKQGYVLAIAVQEGDETFVYSSDVQGPASDAAYDWIADRDPDYLALDGPPTYLVGKHGITQKWIDAAFKQGRRLIRRLDPEWTILDHHCCRQPDFKEVHPRIWEEGAVTVAEFLGWEGAGSAHP